MTHFIFDCDDVLLDWQGGFADWIGKYPMPPPDPAGPQSWSLAQWLGCGDSEAKWLVERFNASPAFGNLKALPHAKNVVWYLRDAGHTISVLTACGDSRAVRNMRSENLHREFGIGPLTPFCDSEDAAKNYANLGLHTLPLGASKFDFLYSFTRNRDPRDITFIDDNFKHAQSGVANGIKTYCVRRSHNRADERDNPASGVIWIDDLSCLPNQHLVEQTHTLIKGITSMARNSYVGKLGVVRDFPCNTKRKRFGARFPWSWETKYFPTRRAATIWLEQRISK